MRLRVAVEDIEPAYWVVWALDLPSGYGAGRSEQEALARAPQQIGDYARRLRAHDGALPPLVEPLEVVVVERFRAYANPEDADETINAFFEDDRRPLGYAAAALGLRVLAWNREEWRALLRGLSPARWAQAPGRGDEGSAATIVRHMAIAEEWYCWSVGVGLEELPDEPLARLEAVRANTMAQLPRLVGETRVLAPQKEIWTARKTLRRTLWHAQDHTAQLRRLLGGNG